MLMFVYDNDCREEVLDNGVRRKIKGYINDLMLVEMVWGKGMEGAVHSHPHRQCTYVISGSFESNMNGEKAVLKAGDCVYTESGIAHGLIALEDAGVIIDIFTPCREDFIATK